MWEDPIVAEVRRIREKLSADLGFDVKAIFADLRKRQTALGARLVQPNVPRGPIPPPAGAAISNSAD